MGEAKRRRNARAPDLNPELKQQIAAIVRRVTLVTPLVGGMCLFRALAQAKPP